MFMFFSQKLLFDFSVSSQLAAWTVDYLSCHPENVLVNTLVSAAICSNLSLLLASSAGLYFFHFSISFSITTPTTMVTYVVSMERAKQNLYMHGTSFLLLCVHSNCDVINKTTEST